MRYIGIIILLVLCLTLLLFTGCMINTVKPEPASGNLENQEDINQSSNNSQSSSTGLVYETVIADTGETVTVYPQQWATGDGTAENPWANDCIQKAYDAVPAGGTIFLRAGYYQLASYLELAKQINIIGEGRNKTIIKTAEANGFHVSQDYCTLKGFTIDGDSQLDGTQYRSPIVVANCDYAVLEDIEVKNAGYYGIQIFGVNNSLFQNIYAHDNYRHGLHPGSNTTGRNKWNTYRDIYCWNNGVSGFDDRGSSGDPNEQLYNIYDNLQCWDNGNNGIYIGSQKGGVLSNSFASGNGREGIWMYDVEDFNVHDCSTTLNGEEGLRIQNSDNINLTNVIIKNNNFSDADNIGGVIIRDSSGIKFASCQSYDDRDTPLQAYGIELTGANTNISLVNCKLTPNKEGEIYNPAGVTLEVITEKREFLLLLYLTFPIFL